jgi:hypothetical protein
LCDVVKAGGSLLEIALAYGGVQARQRVSILFGSLQV